AADRYSWGGVYRGGAHPGGGPPGRSGGSRRRGPLRRTRRWLSPLLSRMAHVSPLRDHHLQEEASLIPYGPPGTDIELVESYGELDFEYAALRKACVLIDLPSRGVLEVRGGDRVDFLQNMLTQNLRGASPLEAGAVRQSFWLNRKGRIE